MFRMLPEASVKIPPKEAPDQPMVPLNTELVLPTSVPLPAVNEPLGFTVKGPFSPSVWPASESVTVPAPLVPRMIAPTVVLPLSETVTPALVMMAVSFTPGTLFGFQFAAVFHPPLAVLVEVMVAASVRKAAIKRNAAATLLAAISMATLALLVPSNWACLKKIDAE